MTGIMHMVLASLNVSLNFVKNLDNVGIQLNMHEFNISPLGIMWKRKQEIQKFMTEEK